MNISRQGSAAKSVKRTFVKTTADILKIAIEHNKAHEEKKGSVTDYLRSPKGKAVFNKHYKGTNGDLHKPVKSGWMGRRKTTWVKCTEDEIKATSTKDKQRWKKIPDTYLDTPSSKEALTAVLKEYRKGGKATHKTVSTYSGQKTKALSSKTGGVLGREADKIEEKRQALWWAEMSQLLVNPQSRTATTPPPRKQGKAPVSTSGQGSGGSGTRMSFYQPNWAESIVEVTNVPVAKEFKAVVRDASSAASSAASSSRSTALSFFGNLASLVEERRIRISNGFGAIKPERGYNRSREADTLQRLFRNNDPWVQVQGSESPVTWLAGGLSQMQAAQVREGDGFWINSQTGKAAIGQRSLFGWGPFTTSLR